MGGLTTKIPYFLCIAFVVAAIVFAIVGAASTNKGWFKSQSGSTKSEIGTLKACGSIGSAKTCCKLKDCMLPDSVVNAGKAALALCICAIVLLIIVAVFAGLRIVHFGGKGKICALSLRFFVAAI